MSQIVLGTAQLDTLSEKRYGQCNQTQLNDLDVQILLNSTSDYKIKRLDTASSYGNLYKHLKIFYQNENHNIQSCSKISSMNWVTDNMSIKDVKQHLKEEHNQIKETNHLEILSFHNFDDYQKSKCYHALLELKEEGYILKIGVSVYYYWQAIKVINDLNMDYLQVPFNILTEFDLDKSIKERGKNPIIVDVRSIFLQGILLNWDYKYWRKIPNLDINRFEKLKTLIEKMCLELVGEFNSTNLTQLYFSYLKSFKWINGVIIGVDNLEQLESNLEIFHKAKPIKKKKLDEFKKYIKEIIQYTPAILDPTLWK